MSTHRYCATAFRILSWLVAVSIVIGYPTQGFADDSPPAGSAPTTASPDRRPQRTAKMRTAPAAAPMAARRKGTKRYRLPPQWWTDAHVVATLQLSEAQVAHIESIFQATRREFQNLTADSRKARRRALAQLAKKEFNREVYDAALEEYQRVEARLAVMQLERKRRIREALTHEQVNALLTLDKKAMRRSWRGAGRSRRPVEPPHDTPTYPPGVD